MTPAAALTMTAASLLLIASHRDTIGSIEAGEGDMGTIDASTLLDRIEAMLNTITERQASVTSTTAARNAAAFLAVLRQAEGTAASADPYRVCYGYRHTIRDLSDHPAITGEWRGELLSDALCAGAGFGPGCKSTAAGAYQIIRPTWQRLRDDLALRAFDAAGQDAAALELIRRRGALMDVQAGRFADAVHKCRNEWASLPGNYAAQGQRNLSTLHAWYSQAGGTTA